MSSPVTLVIFEGGATYSPLEERFRQVRKAVVIDQVIKAQKAGLDNIVLCTPYTDLAEQAKDYGVTVELEEPDEGKFHLGKRLQSVVSRRNLAKVLYMGGAAAPLISANELEYLRHLLTDHQGVVIANNYFSADIIGFTPGCTVDGLDLPAIDNSLPSVLVHQGELRFIPLQRSLGLQFDLDTPGDLLALAVHPRVGYHAKQALEAAAFDISRCEQIKQVIGDPLAELVVFGRVGSLLFKYLDEGTRCRIRLYSEERGLKALGRDVRQEGVSLFARLIESLGYGQFFQFLSEICQGAVLDTRIIFSHFNWNLSQSDRFYSDLGIVDEITHPGLRAFTQAAYNAPIPLMLGGHSLVTGGLWALIEASYLEAHSKPRDV